jgi:hypothetical protein
MVWRITWLALLLPGTLAAQSLPEQVIERVNQARWEHGQLPPLKSNERLAAAAQTHSDAMATRDFIMHCDPDTRLGFAHRVGSTGYRPGLATENLEAGPESADAVMQAWMSDSGQRFNLLADYREIGVGYRADPNDFSSKRSTSQGESCHADRHLDGYYGHYWTQVFGLLYGSYPVVIAREAGRARAAKWRCISTPRQARRRCDSPATTASPGPPGRPTPPARCAPWTARVAAWPACWPRVAMPMAPYGRPATRSGW